MDGGTFHGLRQRPANIQAEMAVLGALLSNNRVRDQCLDLSREHFSDQTLGEVFHHITTGIDAGVRVDPVSLRDHFDHALLANLLAAVISLQIKTYVESVRDSADRCRLIDIGESMVNQSFDSPGALPIAQDAANRLDTILTGTAGTAGITLNEAVDRAIAAMELAMEHQGPTGISTGFPILDERIGGLEAGTLTVLAGRPGMGKSALGWQIAVNVAKSGLGVLAISLEMSAVELGRRALATLSGVSVSAMKYGRVNTDAASRLVLARRELRDLPLTIEDSAGLTAAMITARARSRRRSGLDLVLVDHLHIVRPEDQDARQGATWAVGRISGAMKRLAKDCGCPVVLLAQLSRGVEGRDDKRPGLSDLRQSGDIEQDADAVGFIYRPEYYYAKRPDKKPGEQELAYESRISSWESEKESLAGNAELIWAKIRDGCPGTDDLRFDGATTSFREATG